MTRFSLFCMLLSLLISFSSCTKDDTTQLTAQDEEQVVEAYDGVDEALWPYFKAFEDEARERGFDIDLRASEMTGEIRSLGEDGAAGLCSYQSHQPNHVTVDTDFWNNASDRLREFVVFHELGHCELGRDHREEADENGHCLSLMRSGLGTCRDNYRSTTREAYLTELYDIRFRDEI